MQKNVGLIRHMFITGFGNILMISLIMFSVQYLNIPRTLSYPIPFFIMARINFALMQNFMPKPLNNSLFLYMKIAMGGLFINQIILTLMDGLWYVNDFWVFVAGVFCWIWNYSWNSKYTFQRFSNMPVLFWVLFCVMGIGAIIVSSLYYQT